MNRRNLFQLIAGAVIAPALPRAASKAATRPVVSCDSATVLLPRCIPSVDIVVRNEGSAPVTVIGGGAPMTVSPGKSMFFAAK